MTVWVFPALVMFGLAAQTPSSQTTEPVIVTSATGEVTISPDKAVVWIGVETTESLAAKAARETASKLRALVDTLVALGFSRDSLPTTGYSVGPEWRDGEGERCYQARATIRLDVSDLERIPEILDAALAAGANNIPYIQLEAEDTETARQTAISQAVDKARKDAEALARAAGGRLGHLLELSMKPEYGYAFEMATAEIAPFSSMPFTPQNVTVTARVTAKWQYLEPG